LTDTLLSNRSRWPNIDADDDQHFGFGSVSSNNRGFGYDLKTDPALSMTRTERQTDGRDRTYYHPAFTIRSVSQFANGQ